MNIIIKSLSFLLVAAGITFPQDSLSNYPGIPIVIYPAKAAYNTSLAQFQQMKQMGVYGVVAPNMRRTDYENMKTAGLKIIPQQIDSTIKDNVYGTYIKNDIVKYTDAAYTVWEAEGLDEEDGDVNLQFKSNLGEKFYNENGRDGVRTKNGSSDTLIYGPGYFQYVNYKTIKETDPYITYFIDFELMLKKNDPNFSSMTDTVCVLQVTGSDIEVTRDSALYEWALLVSDFIQSPADWGQWKTISRFYNLSTVEPVLVAGSRAGGIEDIEESAPEITNYFTQFKILYKGGSELQLYVDKITVYDQRGYDIKFVQDIKDKVIAQVNEYKNLTNSAVIGWYGLDEPSSIDNWEPYRIVDSLIHAQDASLYLHTGFTSGWNGKFGESNKGSHAFYTSTEFFKRAKPKNVQINMYNYHYPRKPYPGHNAYSATWQTDNINYVTNELARINQFDENFAFSTQAGAYYKIDTNNCTIADTLLTMLSKKQLLYHVNLGLLYGAKEIRLDPYFSVYHSVCTSVLSTNGLINISGNPTSLWYTFRDTISPRLSGTFGQTLKVLIQQSQHPALDIAVTSTISQQFVDKIEFTSGSGDGIIDLGFFTDEEDTDKKYFMAINRYYSNRENLKFSFQNLSTYKNWEVTDLVDTIKTTILADVNNKGVVYDTISPGDGRLYSVLPVLIYGGSLKYNETLNSEIDLKEELIVEAGATLTINNTYNVYKNITVKPGGKLVVNAGKRMNFLNGSRLIIQGEIVANGTTNNKIIFDFIGQDAQRYNGIRLDSASTATLKYCEITDAFVGVLVSKAEPYIENCEIFYCNDGLYLYKSDYQVTMYTGTKIWNNIIHDNSSSGINLLESSPQISGNEIYNNPIGIKSISGGGIFGELGDPGANDIYDNSISVYGSYSGFELGTEYPSDFFGGYNTIIGDTYHIKLENGGLTKAELNWWGSNPPNSSKILAQSGSSIDYTPYLTFATTTDNPGHTYDIALSKTSSKSNLTKSSPANKNTNIEVVDNTTSKLVSASELLSEARLLFLKNEPDQAWQICKSILSEGVVSASENSSSIILSTLYLLKMFNHKLDINELQTSLTSLSNAENKDGVHGYAEILLADIAADNLLEGRGDYLKKMDEIISEYEGSIKELAMFKKFVYCYFEINNYKSAIEIAEEMNRLFPSSELTKEAASILGENYGIEKKLVSQSIQESKELTISNYPNPFNPTTTIRFSLPEKNHVSLKIFDILGREIVELVNEIKDEGMHSVNFDASYLSSGFYIYTLSTMPNESVA